MIFQLTQNDLELIETVDSVDELSSNWWNDVIDDRVDNWKRQVKKCHQKRLSQSGFLGFWNGFLAFWNGFLTLSDGIFMQI